jgi:small subunit ribosomal protein S3
MKRAVQITMEQGALGIKIRVAGRLGGAEIARTERYHEGKVPLHTLRTPIDYGFTEAETVAGKIGVKCWICKKVEEVPEKVQEPRQSSPTVQASAEAPQAV